MSTYRPGFATEDAHDRRAQALMKRTGKPHLYLWGPPCSRRDAIKPEWLYDCPEDVRPDEALWDWMERMDQTHPLCR